VFEEFKTVFDDDFLFVSDASAAAPPAPPPAPDAAAAAAAAGESAPQEPRSGRACQILHITHQRLRERLRPCVSGLQEAPGCPSGPFALGPVIMLATHSRMPCSSGDEG
jgi:hypothetical protein